MAPCRRVRRSPTGEPLTAPSIFGIRETVKYFVEGGDTYYPGSPYYQSSDGTAYYVNPKYGSHTKYNGSGFRNGWRFGQGTNAPPSPSASTSRVLLAGTVLPPGLLKLSQKLIQNNERLSGDFGLNTRTVISVTRGTDVVNNDGVHTQRWYFTMNDADGSKDMHVIRIGTILVPVKILESRMICHLLQRRCMNLNKICRNSKTLLSFMTRQTENNTMKIYCG